MALLQTAWFVVQVIARARQNLAISELELTTAALAGLNSIIFLCWWNEPLAIHFPVFVRTKEVCRLHWQAIEDKDIPWTFQYEEFSLNRYLWYAIILSVLKTLAFGREMAMHMISICFGLFLYCLM